MRGGSVKLAGLVVHKTEESTGEGGHFGFLEIVLYIPLKYRQHS